MPLDNRGFEPSNRRSFSFGDEVILEQAELAGPEVFFTADALGWVAGLLFGLWQGYSMWGCTLCTCVALGGCMGSVIAAERLVVRIQTLFVEFRLGSPWFYLVRL